MKHMAAKLRDLNDAWPTERFAPGVFKVDMFSPFLYGIWVDGWAGTCMAGLAAAAFGGPRCHPMPCS